MICCTKIQRKSEKDYPDNQSSGLVCCIRNFSSSKNSTVLYPGFYFVLLNRMARRMGLFEEITFLVSIILLNLLVVTPAATRRCPAGKFLPPDSLLDECRPCSLCPVNEIIRRPCTDESDTECGPFYEFQNFNSFQGKTEMDLGKLMEEYGKKTDSPWPVESENLDRPEDLYQQSEKGNVATSQKGNFIYFFPER